MTKMIHEHDTDLHIKTDPRNGLYLLIKGDRILAASPCKDVLRHANRFLKLPGMQSKFGA